MTNLIEHKEALRDWWDFLPVKVQSALAFNYAVSTDASSLFDKIKESIDTESLEDEDVKYPTYSCNPLFYTFKRDFEIPSIIHFSLDDERFFNWTNTYYHMAEDDEKKISKLKVSFDFNNLSELKYLEWLEKVYLFSNDNNIEDLLLFPELTTLNIKAKLLPLIPAIAKLNLKKLRTINVFMSDYTYADINKDYRDGIDLLKKVTNFKFNTVYDDLNDTNDFEVDMLSENFYHIFRGLDEPSDEELYNEHISLIRRK
jgi:hypothetical protein